MLGVFYFLSNGVTAEFALTPLLSVNPKCCICLLFLSLAEFASRCDDLTYTAVPLIGQTIADYAITKSGDYNMTIYSSAKVGHKQQHHVICAMT